jgi:rhodanese-related sulfurtransferase
MKTPYNNSIKATGNTFAYVDVAPSDAADMVANGGAFILDVRTPQEWNWVGHRGQNKLGEGAYLESVHKLSVSVCHSRSP